MDQKSECSFNRYFWLKVFHEVAFKLSSVTMVAREGSIGEESNYKFTHVIVGRLIFSWDIGVRGSVPCRLFTGDLPQFLAQWISS